MAGDGEDDESMSREEDDLHVMLYIDGQADGRDGCEFPSLEQLRVPP